MKKKRHGIDTTRASRDGHEFHEAWAARKALQLVMQTDGLVGIAVEGLAPFDQTGASKQTIEIADLVLYHGKRATFEGANSTVIVQLKYSKGSENVPFRASDAKKTVTKFASAFKSLSLKHGTKNVEKKLAFELITNRPVYPALSEAIEALASNIAPTGEIKKQAAQFMAACGFKDDELTQFAKRVRISGLAGNLRQNKLGLSRVLADWSVAPDAMARARLGNMRQLLRDKAGLVGDGSNVITRTDVLDAMEVQSPDDLFPCPASFPVVHRVVNREQLSDLVSRVPELNRPLLIHADGGVGKTVFLQSLANTLSETHEVILFDCFGGGSYRAPEDARHLPKRGLIHIINSLACNGLCDPLLPINENVEELVRAFRTRLTQAVATLRRGSKGKQLLLFIDAIDNAAEHARDKSEQAFPRLLLQSFHHNGPVVGVQLIVSCRTYRRDISRGDIPCEELELQPFTPREAERYLRDRIAKVTGTQIHVAYSRSKGNPRVLEHLVLSDRGLLDPSKINSVIQLDDLLKDRIRKALGEALNRGYREQDIGAFLAGLSVLPPPVPLDEYADAHGMELSAVKSFAADLAPLLEQTKYGLMFRDEPTETFVRRVYAAHPDTLRTLSERLFRKQGSSVYAASALPGLLQKIDDGKLLFDLAFDERFPAAITSTVGKQNIRYARLKAAVLHATRSEHFNHLVHLLVELSTLAAINQRGTEYVFGNPDLVIASHDVDATRRLFEMRTGWPGTRYARLTIASVLSGDLSDACRHAVTAEEWIRHFYRQDDDYRREKGGPERIDIVSIPLCLVAQGRAHDAANFLKEWKDWYAYEVAECLFTLLRQAQGMGTIPSDNVLQFLNALKSQSGVLAAALTLDLDMLTQRMLIRELAKGCKDKPPIETSKKFRQERDHHFQDGLLKAGAIAIVAKMYEEALVVVHAIPNERPRLWSYADRFSNDDVSPFITCIALRAAVEKQTLTENAILPLELVDIGKRIPSTATGDIFRKALKVELEVEVEVEIRTQEGLTDGKKPMSQESKREAEHYIDHIHEPLLQLAMAFTEMLASKAGDADKQFLQLVDIWAKLRVRRNRYSDVHELDRFFDLLGREFLTFSLSTRSDLRASSVGKYAATIVKDDIVTATTLITTLTALSPRPNFQEIAGKLAMRANALIAREDEVSHRSSLFAKLSRAIMPASFEEAAIYFRAGLEQMDAIGSGDYQFTNELLLFAAELQGEEIDQSDFHTLSNICELNMPSEEEKFPWFAFARGLARTAGCRMLAKLSRWDDRDKISLSYTLLPYLTALIEQDKMDPAIALGLLRLSDPAELYVCGTEQLAEVIAGKHYPNSKELLAELILQFEQNHPGVFMPGTLATLHKIAEREFGKTSEQTIYLSRAAPKFEQLRDEDNEIRNFRGEQTPLRSGSWIVQEQENRVAVQKIEEETDPCNEASVSQAIDALNTMQHTMDLRVEFFRNLREKVRYSDRPKYIHIIAHLEALDIYPKLRELNECKSQWSGSSAALEEVFRSIGVPLIQVHTDDFVSHDYLSTSKLKEIADLSGISMAVLALELIKIFTAPDFHLAASVWMGLAAIICKKSKRGEGQTALKRLLNSNSAKLASTVVDGAWMDGLYPEDAESSLAGGLVWQMLGSPSAAYRWRAAHSIRRFARFGKWGVIDVLFEKYYSTTAHPYQAPELPFFFLHARLWLLIAIARVALDHAESVAKYAPVLRTIALDTDNPHVLLRQFATHALLTCASSGSIVLPESDLKTLMTVNKSPFRKRRTKEYPSDSFYRERPKSMPEQVPEFHLDYDFDKTDVTSISEMFEQSRWKTTDVITEWVRKYDPAITHMYESSGRSVSQRQRLRGMNNHHHVYGQQLGWHALYLTAGSFLSKYPIVQRPYEDNSWDEWLRRELLTRNDGLWLADGVDRPPIEAQVNLREKGENGAVLTGDPVKLLSLLKIDPSVTDELVVGGDWRSADGVGIHINSALATSRQAQKIALELAQEDPFQAWLPRAEDHDGDGEFFRSQKESCKPWIVWPSIETRLDDTDPLGVSSAARRLYFTKATNSIGSLQTLDPFKRTWVDPNGGIAARSEAWGRNARQDDEELGGAERLICTSDFLKEVLFRKNSELLILVRLRRYEKGYAGKKSEYWHTTAVVRIDGSLNHEIYLGSINKLHVMNY